MEFRRVSRSYQESCLAKLSMPEVSMSNSTISPVTVKITRSQMLVTRSAERSRLWATHSRWLACSMAERSAATR